jgi:Tfp pilus assembly protein FimT
MHIKPITTLGVTLPELATTICISGVYVTVAIPNFLSAMATNRTITSAN